MNVLAFNQILQPRSTASKESEDHGDIPSGKSGVCFKHECGYIYTRWALKCTLECIAGSLDKMSCRTNVFTGFKITSQGGHLHGKSRTERDHNFPQRFLHRSASIWGGIFQPEMTSHPHRPAGSSNCKDSRNTGHFGSSSHIQSRSGIRL